MSVGEGQSAGSGLFPTTRSEAHLLYHVLREEVTRTVVGHEEEVQRLVLLCVRHMARDLAPPLVPLRGLMLGPAGSGKSVLLRSIIDATGLPAVLIPAATMTEMNWSGADVGDFLGRLCDDGAPGTEKRQQALSERAVIVIDGVDALRLPGRYGSASSREYQLGRQRGLIPLIEGADIPVERSGRTEYWPSERALVIVCGALTGLPDRIPTADDLTDWGLIPQLSEHLATGSIFRLRDRARVHLPRILEHNLEGPMQAYTLFGYELRVSPEAIAFVSDRVDADLGRTGVRAAIACLVEASERVLAGMVRNAAPAGTCHVLAPDDIQPLPTSRGTWRE
jgi:hypothetical protein